MSKRLSILICSLEDRKESLDRLLSHLEKQKTDDVEILVETDKKEITTGAKRNILLERATGDYVVFIDDDDMVSDDYVPKILKAIESNPDSCSVRGTVTIGSDEHLFINSVKIDHWGYLFGSLLRRTNHVNPVRRELALRAKFPDINAYEDREYSLRLKPLLKIEVEIAGSIYYYLPKK